jgi:hypothetical protein
MNDLETIGGVNDTACAKDQLHDAMQDLYRADMDPQEYDSYSATCNFNIKVSPWSVGIDIIETGKTKNLTFFSFFLTLNQKTAK